jgi:hypothetical protein
MEPVHAVLGNVLCAKDAHRSPRFHNSGLDCLRTSSASITRDRSVARLGDMGLASRRMRGNGGWRRMSQNSGGA